MQGEVQGEAGQAAVCARQLARRVQAAARHCPNWPSPAPTWRPALHTWLSYLLPLCDATPLKLLGLPTALGAAAALPSPPQSGRPAAAKPPCGRPTGSSMEEAGLQQLQVT